MKKSLYLLAGVFLAFQVHAQTNQVLVCTGISQRGPVRLEIDQLGGGHFALRSNFTLPMTMKRTSLSVLAGANEEMQLVLTHIEGSSFRLDIPTETISLQCESGAE